MTQGITINTQAQLGTFLDTEEGTSEDRGSNPDSVLCNPRQSLTRLGPVSLPLKKKKKKR